MPAILRAPGPGLATAAAAGVPGPEEAAAAGGPRAAGFGIFAGHGPATLRETPEPVGAIIAAFLGD